MAEYESQPHRVDRYLEAYESRLRRTMVLEAQKDRTEIAKNHRGFLVGCAVAAVVQEGYGMEEAKIFSAGNYTPESKKKNSEAKWCAERIAINLALAEKGTFIPAIVTVSDRVDTGEGGQVHDVLHPCPECRNLLRHLIEEGIMDEETKVCNVNDSNPDKLIMEEHTLKELLEKYPEQK